MVRLATAARVSDIGRANKIQAAQAGDQTLCARARYADPSIHQRIRHTTPVRMFDTERTVGARPETEAQ